MQSSHPPRVLAFPLAAHRTLGAGRIIGDHGSASAGGRSGPAVVRRSLLLAMDPSAAAFLFRPSGHGSPCGSGRESICWATPRLGVRLAAVLGGLATSLAVWDATRLAFSSRPAGATAALWLNAVLLFGAAGGHHHSRFPPAALLGDGAVGADPPDRRRPRPLPLCRRPGARPGRRQQIHHGADPARHLRHLSAVPRLRPWCLRLHAWLAALLALACTAPVVLWNSETTGRASPSNWATPSPPRSPTP